MTNRKSKKAKRQTALPADIAYMLLLILMFVCVVFILYAKSQVFSIIALCAVFSIMIITHFTSVTMGLVINIIIIFACFTFYLYQLMSKGNPIDTEIYFWMIISPVMTIISSEIFRNVREMEKQNRLLENRVRNFSLVDDLTELKNIQAYEMELPIYAKIAARYNIGLMMIVWEFRYADDLRRMLGSNNLEQTAVAISRAIEEVFRTEDVIYILSRDPYVWGTLLLTKDNSEDILRERMKKKLEHLEISEIVGKNAPKLEFRIGVYFAGDPNETALSMLDKAKNRLQYDV